MLFVRIDVYDDYGMFVCIFVVLWVVIVIDVFYLCWYECFIDVGGYGEGIGYIVWCGYEVLVEDFGVEVFYMFFIVIRDFKMVNVVYGVFFGEIF